MNICMNLTMMMIYLSSKTVRKVHEISSEIRINKFGAKEYNKSMKWCFILTYRLCTIIMKNEGIMVLYAANNSIEHIIRTFIAYFLNDVNEKWFFRAYWWRFFLIRHISINNAFNDVYNCWEQNINQNHSLLFIINL